MQVTLTLSANAGVAIRFGGRRIWVDALHDKKLERFSTVTPKMQQQLLQQPAFSHPDYICYTHCHPDHYSEHLTDVATRIWPNARIFAPDGKYRCTEPVMEPDFSIRYMALPHEGEQYRDVAHYGIVLSSQGKNILLCGDCALCSQELLGQTQDMKIDLMLLTFPWLTMPKANHFLKEHFADSNKVYYHLPFEEDDVFGYRRAAMKAAQRDGGILLSEPFQQVNINI